MSTKMMKVLITIATILMVVTMLGTTALATFGPTDIEIDPGETTEIKELGGKLMGILQAVGVVVAVLILMVIGIKYMMGSAEEKAEYKKTMIPYIVGAILLFGATTIANMVYKFAEGI